MIKTLFYILSFCLGEIEAARLNMDVDQVIESALVATDGTIGIYEQWLKDYEGSDAPPYLENLIWQYYHIKKDEASELKHLKAFLKCCKDEIDLCLTSHESRDKLLELLKSVLEELRLRAQIPDTSDASCVNGAYSKFLEELLGDDKLLKKIIGSMNSWD